MNITFPSKENNNLPRKNALKKLHRRGRTIVFGAAPMSFLSFSPGGDTRLCSPDENIFRLHHLNQCLTLLTIAL